MTERVSRFPVLRRLGKWLIVAVGILSILLATALGVFRLLLGQVPEYQDELKAWVADELGVEIEFASLNAQLGLAGPELSLSDTSIGGGFLRADQASITLDPVALFSRDFRVSRLTLNGVLLTLERDQAGSFRLGDYVIEPGTGALADSIPDSVEVRIRDSALRYVDSVRSREWDFSDLEIDVESDGEQLVASGSLNELSELARRIDWEATAVQSADDSNAGDWRVEARLAGLDLEQLAELFPDALPLAESGVGNLAAELEWSSATVQRVMLDLDFEDLQIVSTGGDDALYSELALSADWKRAGPGDWMVGIEDLRVSREGVTWPEPVSASFELVSDARELQSVRLGADFIRIADLGPLVRAYPDSQLAEQWNMFRPEGDISELALMLERRDGDVSYDIDMQFEQLQFEQVGSTPGLSGLSGSIEATEESGTVDFSSGPWQADWPTLFPRMVGAESLTGALVWRQWDDVLSLTSVDLAFDMLDHNAGVSFELRLPLDDRAASIRLEASLEGADLVAAKQYLPAPVMPARVVDWLEQAITGGTARDIDLMLSGPLSAFPFDDGSGQFRVTATIENATLDYRGDWPLAEELNGEIEFVNASFAARASGRVLSNRSENVFVGIAEMREPVLTLAADTAGPLTGVVEYLRGSPLIAAEFGPDFDRVSVLDGDSRIALRLDLPLRDPGGFALDAELEIRAGTVTLGGLGPAITDISGTVFANETAVTADGLDAQFLGGPVMASVLPSEHPGYRAEILLEGETTADAVAESFDLPHQDLLAGQTRWSGNLLLPALDPLATTRTRFTVESNLTGVALRFPEPLAKEPGDPVNLRLDIDFRGAEEFEIYGNIGASRRFVLAFESQEQGLEFINGTVRFGGEEPVLPTRRGILVDGRLESVQLDPWFDLAGESALGDAGPLFLGADLQIADFHALGQRLGATGLRVEQGADNWEIVVDSEAIAGRISVPRGSTTREPIVANMERVYLATEGEADLGGVDPRELPGISIQADEFGFGNRQLGRVEVTVEPDARGLLLKQFSGATDHYATELSGSWFQGSLGTRTTIDARIVSSDIQTALAELGLDPVMSGESAELTASVYWDSAPGGTWLEHLNGDVEIRVDTGTLREIDPGAGRMLGLMSIAAMPRRLALDFRDVFEDGFAFDEIRGGFTIIDGNAYTDNLKLDGPAAEIGVVGRTGLRDRDYTQQIVVSSEPGNMLPTVAGLLGGAGAGAAIFVFTRVFKRSFDVIGSVSYCVTGSWEEPTVERIEDDASDQAASCADLPEAMMSENTID